MKSMTGFASLQVANVSLKLKSVNHRFLDFRFHAPQDYFVYESELRQKISKIVSRGSLDLFLQIKSESSTNNLEIDLEKSKGFLTELKKLSKTSKVKLKDEMDLILRYGSVLKTSEAKSLSKEDLFKSFDQLCEVFQKERHREGLALKNEILELLKNLEKVRLTLESYGLTYTDEIQQKFKDKLKVWKTEVDPQRLQQEILIYIDKADITEEVVRLKEHIKACKELVESSTSEGKKLDFYAQELFREANTIGSKSSSVKITQEVMQAKAIIEKIRQQVQNVE